MKTVLAVLALAALGSAQGPLADALRKGVIEEDSNRNLPAAIQAYQSVIRQFDGDRETAATALFRLAECYRKQGRTDLAIAAYRRIVQEFADQTRLAVQSRRYLPNSQPKTAARITPQMAEARRKYREILGKGILTAQKNWDFIKKQSDLGAVSYLETYEPQRMLTQLQGELAAFDAGLIQPQPAAPDNPKTAEARKRYRELLAQEVELAQKSYEGSRKRYELGVMDLNALEQTELLVYNTELKLYAFDAGFARPSPLPAPAK